MQAWTAAAPSTGVSSSPAHRSTARCGAARNSAAMARSAVRPRCAASPRNRTSATARFPGDAGPDGCSSNADCGEREHCFSEQCGGPGQCRDVDGCQFCTPEGSPECQRCGCDGVTYASPQHACAAGQRTALAGACGEVARVYAREGVIACGRDSQCPDSMSCCALTGECFNRDEPWRCGAPSESLPHCLVDAECESEPNARRCLSAAGCHAPGFCRTFGIPDSCGGEVNKVCGCDGVTYLNPCRAFQGGASIASSGPCP